METLVAYRFARPPKADEYAQLTDTCKTCKVLIVYLLGPLRERTALFPGHKHLSHCPVTA